MADIINVKKFLDQDGVTVLWSKIAAEVDAAEKRAKADAATAQGSANQALTNIGTLGDLKTNNKDNLVTAINEIVDSTGSVVTLTKSEDGLRYTLTQGETKVGDIDIPKDMVVQSGSVVVDPEGQAAGTYIKLILANVTDPLYINVGSLVDLYTATENATQIQLNVDNSTRKISATIVAGSVGTAEVADNAITTAKIADANVTLAKLSTELQGVIEKANNAVQSVTSGSANGTIAVDNTDVAVTGLKSAAFAEASAFDPANAASDALNEAKTYTDNKTQAMSTEDIDAAIAAATEAMNQVN